MFAATALKQKKLNWNKELISLVYAQMRQWRGYTWGSSKPLGKSSNNLWRGSEFRFIDTSPNAWKITSQYYVSNRIALSFLCILHWKLYSLHFSFTVFIYIYLYIFIYSLALGKKVDIHSCKGRNASQKIFKCTLNNYIHPSFKKRHGIN